ncbi:hypothetical protein MLD38_014420 [Melastoma candidum]|uniref:Uncharacterized protein n=1 Tax=Melastoma candidum TaxID=119954 RepID=A0ACB9RGF1_9MYRT|nr:hypothetical protein MLD38_014420 [Melastoma candidum]
MTGLHTPNSSSFPTHNPTKASSSNGDGNGYGGREKKLEMGKWELGGEELGTRRTCSFHQREKRKEEGSAGTQDHSSSSFNLSSRKHVVVVLLLLFDVCCGQYVVVAAF